MQDMTPLQKYLLQRKLMGGGVGPEMGMPPPTSAMGVVPDNGVAPPTGPSADPFTNGMSGTELDDPMDAQNEFQRKKMMAMRPYLGG